MTSQADLLRLDLALDALTLDDLRLVVDGMASDERLWRPRVRFREDGRWWTRLHGDHALDVWLLTWLTDQSTELHDHGDSAAAFTVVQGELSEVRVRGLVEDHHRVTAGQTVTVDAGVVHDVRNPR